ncbi:bb in a boxcar [Anaeramoeba flamelloides]|uniref:Bb in a boxcar n=1 Tax=Anaeramoeba flamelloides TaxID=1746091 RepID=A0ABQ8YDA5_9EUKA|nr:bb in a boxcar [Anaeramoeba flamelloides]
MEEPLPRYILIFSPLTVIFYNICDNCDGKQARKTDNASPLGQMFDHGIDCVVGLYVIQNTTTTIQAGNTWIQYLILIGTLGCFYMATWDEYWCGNFYLGMFNGPNEGNLFVIILNFLVFIKPDLFAMNIFGKKLSDIALPPLLIALIPVLIVNISRVSKSGNLKQYGIKRAFITTIPNIAAVAVTLGWRILNPSLFDNYPRFTWTIVGFLFANLNFRILLAHLSKNFKNWYYAQSFWVLIYIPVLYHFFGMKFISEKLFIYTYASLLILAFVHLFTSVTIDVSSYLGIKVFKNKPVFIKKKKRTFLKNK